MLDNERSLMMMWEEGTLDQTNEIELFQSLVSSNRVWNMSGAYPWNAKRLISEGLVTKSLGGFYHGD